MTWLSAARQVVETAMFVTVNQDGQVVETDWKALERLETEDPDQWSEPPDTSGHMILDLFSASAMVQIHDGLSEANRERFLSMPIIQAHGIAMRIANKERV